MKKSFLLYAAFLITASFFSCKKEGAFSNSALQGDWELRYSTNAPGTPEFYAAGNGRTIEFKGTQVTFYSGSLMTNAATYNITKYNGSCAYAKGNLMINFSDETGDGHPFEIKGDTLKLSSPPCVEDGGLELYVKIPSPARIVLHD